MFAPGHLEELDKLLSGAHAVVAMQEIHAGNHRADVIGLRHDVDDNDQSLLTAVRIAEWEAARGYRSTYYLLHSASYWTADGFEAAVTAIGKFGHEIGIHANAIAESLRGHGGPDDILWSALETLRGLGFPVRGVAGHGDQLCGQAGFVNDEQFVECARENMGAPDRTLTHNGCTLTLAPKPLNEFGLLYETLRLPRADYLSDSGGRWNQTVADTTQRFPTLTGQLHILWHPDWWRDAL